MNNKCKLVTTNLHALKKNVTQVPLETSIEVVFIPLNVHSTFSGNDQLCHNPNLGLVTKARACKSVGQE
jgi:hypothetical protein